MIETPIKVWRSLLSAASNPNEMMIDRLTVVVSFLHLSVPPKMLKELVLA